MAGPYYVDSAASGADDGTSWTDAWTTLQRAIDGTDGTQPVAGDIVYCRGTETVSTSIDMDGNSGDTTSSHIRFIGCNASGVNDGTRYKLNANNNSIDVIASWTMDYISFENFEIYGTANANNNGIEIDNYTNVEGLRFINVYIHDCYDGFSLGSGTARGTLLFKCRAESNRNYGIKALCQRSVFIIGCSAKNNTSDNIYNLGGGTVIVIAGCIIEGSGGKGIELSPTADYGVLIMNNVIDGNTGDGLECSQDMILISNRITNNGVGIDSDHLAALLFNYMPDTGQDRANTTKTAGLITEITISGSNSNNLSGTDTDGGYNAPGSEDFNLADTATLRRSACDLDE